MQESPYAMVYQRQPIFLGELAIDQDYSNPFVEEIRDRIALTETIIAKNYKKQQEEDKERFDSKRRLISYQPGQWVSVYVPKTKIGMSKKLMPFFFGPYEIVEKISDITYRVRIGHGEKARVEPIHVERLKPFFKREGD
jgi:ribosomal protein L21E